MSDLQCAARLVVLNPPGLTDVEALASSLAREKVAAVYAAADLPDLGLVAWLAEQVGATVELVGDSLSDTSSGFEEVVDRHRGETAVLVRRGESAAPVLLLVDADGATSHPIGR